MFTYNHFQKNKLKYVIVVVFLILLLVLIKSYCNVEARFTNKEGFANEMIVDVLLGKKFDNKEENRISLSDNIKESRVSGENELNIIYSTYYTKSTTGGNAINIFLRTQVAKTTKIIGDLCLQINSDKLAFDSNDSFILNNENVPHLLNPILKEVNALELTEEDIKMVQKTSGVEDYDIIEKTHTFGGNYDYTTILINLLGIESIDDIYFDDNVKKIYNFYNKGKKDIDFLSKNKTQVLKDLTYVNNTDDATDLLKIIKNVTYVEELEIYYNEIVGRSTYEIGQLAIVLSNILKSNIQETNEGGYPKRIYAGYTINVPTLNFTVPFTMDDGGKMVTITKNNKYRFKNNVLKKLKYEKPNNAKEIKYLLANYEVFVDEITLLKNTELETKFYIPYLETLSDSSNDDGGTSTEISTMATEVGGAITPIIIDINSNKLISQLETHMNDTPDVAGVNTIKQKITTFQNKIDYILHNSAFLLKLPLKIIRMKDPQDDATHVIFGDILDTGNVVGPEKNILSNYVKIPRRCCYKTDQFYGDDNNKPIMSFKGRGDMSFKGRGDISYNIYQHPIYKTFKVFTENEMEDEKDIKYIYEIEPCAPNVSLYENNIIAYNKLKKNCKNIKTASDGNKIKDNSFNKLQIKTKLNTINKNKQNLNSLRKEINKLQIDLDRKDILKSNYNRVKLQKHNEHKQEQIYEATRRLNKKDSVGINITYPQEVLNHLLEVYKEKNILNPDTQGKYNDIYNKLLNLDNSIGNKEYNNFATQQMKKDNTDVIKLLPDTNSEKFKNKWINKNLLEILEGRKEAREAVGAVGAVEIEG